MTSRLGKGKSLTFFYSALSFFREYSHFSRILPFLANTSISREYFHFSRNPLIQVAKYWKKKSMITFVQQTYFLNYLSFLIPFLYLPKMLDSLQFFML
jgi:hypothetical protein